MLSAQAAQASVIVDGEGAVAVGSGAVGASQYSLDEPGNTYGTVT